MLISLEVMIEKDTKEYSIPLCSAVLILSCDTKNDQSAIRLLVSICT